jgi:predicted aldo/keto reductase-like oxidoreductase
MKRRSFLVAALGSAVVAKAGAKGSLKDLLDLAETAELGSTKPLSRRHFRDDVYLSIIGFGGMTLLGMEQSDVNSLLAQAFERGVNYFDVAPRYGDGEAEIKMGLALSSYREKVFLACKTEKRNSSEAQIELDRSLKRLKTDHFDLYQFHALNTVGEVDQILGPGGAAETFLKARRDGKVRYLGFSAHSEDAALALMDRFRVDSVMFPVNYVCYEQGRFGPQVLKHAKQMNVARIALKPMAYSKNWEAHPDAFYRPIQNAALAIKALRFTLSEDVTSAFPPGALQMAPAEKARLYHLALDYVSGFTPLTSAERRDLLASSAGIKPLFQA